MHIKGTHISLYTTTTISKIRCSVLIPDGTFLLLLKLFVVSEAQMLSSKSTYSEFSSDSGSGRG